MAQTRNGKPRQRAKVEPAPLPVERYESNVGPARKALTWGILGVLVLSLGYGIFLLVRWVLAGI